MTTLLVCADPAVGEPIAEALERAGDDVMWCRGPSGTDCVCAAIRGNRCPLTSGIDAVVVDSCLASDQRDRGFRSSQLVKYYEDLGLPVVVLVGLRDLVQTFHYRPRTLAMPRRSDPVDVAAAARGAAALSAAGHVREPA